MKIKILKTGEIKEYQPGYAVRLIEQGKAVLYIGKKDDSGRK